MSGSYTAARHCAVTPAVQSLHPVDCCNLMCCCCCCCCLLLGRFQNESHVELPCNEVPEPQASTLAHIMSSAARAWWQSLVADSSSFTKPTYYLGLGKWRVTNMLADGAHERTPGKITLLANGATGFRAAGDRMCFKTKVGC
jgi:hypothetical protein